MGVYGHMATAGGAVELVHHITKTGLRWTMCYDRRDGGRRWIAVRGCWLGLDEFTDAVRRFQGTRRVRFRSE